MSDQLHAVHEHHNQFRHDLPRLLDSMRPGRRQAMRWLSAGALGVAVPSLLSACGSGGDSFEQAATDGTGNAGTGTGGTATGSSASGSSATTDTTSSTASSCSTIPEETAGPYPGDGTNTMQGSVVNVLTLAGVVRQDIRASFGSASGRADGVALTVRLRLVNTNLSCANLAGYAVYLWHCDRDGNYSLYSNGVTQENYLRGVQVADAHGEVSFTTIFPGCYAGRWPHIHFEVFPSLELATSGAYDVKTSQLALPEDICRTVYAADSGYSASTRNLSRITLATDNVFRDDGAARQMATVSGSVTEGYVATLQVGVAA